MNLSDIDFGAIQNMINSLSDEEKEKLNAMAQNMAESMKENAQAQPEEPEEEESDLFAELKIDEDRWSLLPGNVLSAMEAGHDMEEYYEDEAEADLSAAVLYYCKALLFALRKYAWPVLNAQEMLAKAEAATTLQDYYTVLAAPGNVSSLHESGFGSEPAWRRLSQILFQAYLLLNRAEYDEINAAELAMLKEDLFKDDGLLLVKSAFAAAPAAEEAK